MGARSKEGPSLERLYSIRTDGSRRKLHPSDVRGRFVRARRAVFALLVLAAVAMPWVRLGGHPAVQIDIANRRFYLFGAAFNAQDTWMLVFLLVAGAFGILFVTAWLGRVWCGWACPQSVFLEGLYRPIERLIEGPGEKRYRFDQAPMSAGKLARKIVKHVLYIVASMAIAHGILSFFVSGRALIDMMQHSPGEHPEAFGWMLAFTGLLYFNFAWFREQMCIVVCPYGRLQGVLVDDDSMVIGYDKARGEPRAHRDKGKRREGAGDCVDCNRCVVVCPTGIDIRHGMQLECVACAQCIDACDEVMDKLQQPRGLIRYASQNQFEGKGKRVIRPRLIAYFVLFALAVAGAGIAAARHKSFEANLLRVRGTPYVRDVAADGKTTWRNTYELHLVNKRTVPTTFVVTPKAPVAAEYVLPQGTLTLAPGEGRRVPIVVLVDDKLLPGPFDFSVSVSAADETVTSTGRFLAPAR
jgi:cytochrome c oxidase accessory protein FixG